ncbi:MAG: hydroxyisourate hydrolase [Kangiellaceae bacterium]|nr:hydroxyisourate hydrolase [Kangiellaceae bacterium]
MSQITTHVLDTSRGKPAAGINIELFEQTNNQWHSLAKGITNTDGRIAGLLAEDIVLDAGIYRMNFSTADYFNANSEQGFYPYVDIVFELEGDGSHYHIPLLLSAFGYSTYRGS